MFSFSATSSIASTGEVDQVKSADGSESCYPSDDDSESTDCTSPSTRSSSIVEPAYPPPLTHIEQLKEVHRGLMPLLGLSNNMLRLGPIIEELEAEADNQHTLMKDQLIEQFAIKAAPIIGFLFDVIMKRNL